MVVAMAMARSHFGLVAPMAMAPLQKNSAFSHKVLWYAFSIIDF
jgi:hypothetical protein